MDGRARFSLPVVMAFCLALSMTAVVTFIDPGLPRDYLPHWMRASVVAWPLTPPVAFAAVPLTRRITATIMAFVERG
jgi:hypothetical protein